METPNHVGFRDFQNIDAFEAKMDDFMSSAVLQRHPGGHGLAMPSWTIIPILYHAPPDFLAPSKKDEDPNVQDEYGTNSEIEVNFRKHQTAMKTVQKHASEGLAAMEAMKYYEAVKNFNTALLELRQIPSYAWDRDTACELWIETHRGHALLRAGLLQCPALHGQNTVTLLKASWETMSGCVATLRSCKNLYPFNRSLLFSGLLGLAWISFFRGNLKEVEQYIREAQSVSLDPSHLRADRDIDTIFLEVALHRVTGNLEDTQHSLDKVGHELSDYHADTFLVTLLDREVNQLQGSFLSSVHMSVTSNFAPVPYRKYASETHNKKVVFQFMDQLEAGYAGNMWLALGACRQARVAYEFAYASDSLLLRAAALVGLGNVLMRVVKREVSATGNKEIHNPSDIEADGSQLGFTEAEKKYKEALKIYDELGYEEGQILVQCNLGNLYHKREQFRQALERYTTAMTYFSEKMYKSSAALHLHLKVAELHLQRENWVEALISIQKAAEIPTTINPFAGAWIQHLYGGYYLKKAMATESKNEQLNNLFNAKIHLCKAAKCFAEIQVNFGVETSLWTISFEQQKETYALLLWCLACLQENSTSAIEALVWCERSRSRALMVEWASNCETSDEVVLATASHSFDTLECEESWKHLQVLLSRCKLPTATVVVEYVLCEDFGFLIFVLDIPGGVPKMLRVSFKEQELNGEKLDREKLTALVNRTITQLYPNVGQKEEAETNLASLYKLLIKPVEKWLEKSVQIIVIPHEVLFKVPFHALIDGRKNYLIQRYALSCAESIRSLVKCWLLWEPSIHARRAQDHQNPPSDNKTRRWLVVGINKHKPVAADLKFAESEATQVARLKFDSSETVRKFLGSQATKDHLKPQFENADIIHLATHGIINAKYERGGILFAAPAGAIGEKTTGIVNLEPSYSAAEYDDEPTFRSVDDFHENVRSLEISESLGEKIVLSANEISKMRLKARLVVISACQSADGVILGEGVAGLGRALLRAGVPCTVLSLWPVSDKGTIDFMDEFYRALFQGQSVADAMKTVMVNMIKADAPYSKKRKYTVRHWAAFWAYGLPIIRLEDPPLQMQPSPHPAAISLKSKLTDKLLPVLVGVGVMAIAQVLIKRP